MPASASSAEYAADWEAGAPPPDGVSGCHGKQTLASSRTAAHPEPSQCTPCCVCVPEPTEYAGCYPRGVGQRANSLASRTASKASEDAISFLTLIAESLRRDTRWSPTAGNRDWPTDSGRQPDVAAGESLGPSVYAIALARPGYGGDSLLSCSLQIGVQPQTAAICLATVRQRGCEAAREILSRTPRRRACLFDAVLPTHKHAIMCATRRALAHD